MLRRTLISISAVTAAAALLAVPAGARRFVAPAGSGALLLIRGHGWGHGVGMSQWGAQGYAEHAYTYEQILSAYYPGTTLGTAPAAATTIRVLLAEGKKTLSIFSDQPITVTDANAVQHTLPAGTTKLTPALQLAVDGGPAQPLAPPLTFAPASGSSLTLGRPYGGTITVDVVDNRLQAVNTLPLEEYVAGVVPAEMPSTWQPQALEVQAVASRSYALATRRVGASFDVYADSRSQAYGGIDAETPAATAAVAATQGQVLYYGKQIATTFFSSSSGGRTQSAADAWGQSIPYLPSVPDPYDSISPYHDWGPVPVPAETLARALGLKGHVVDATTAINSSLRVAQLDIDSLVGATPTATPVSGAVVQAKLGLRSTWFRVSVLSLRPPAPDPAVTPGTKVTLTGVLRGAPGAIVQQRSAGRAWTTLRSPRPGPRTHAFRLVVRPTVTTWYRLSVPAATSGQVRIRVAP